MIERQKRTGLLIMITGAIVILLAVFLEAKSFQSGLLSGLGAALFVMGFVRIIKMNRLLKDPDKAADYEANFTDERTAIIAGRAGKFALFITAYAEIAVGIVAAFAFDNQLVCQILCYGACFSCLLYYAMFIYFNKRG
ncbi:MAG: hypothetical protein PHS19_03970 [Eubacteriales bacterium]|nr:hypothetical protein [Eubacteriales bacterium]